MTNPPSLRLSGGLASPFSRRNTELTSPPTAEEPREIIARIQSHFGSALNPATRAELNSLASERDASLFYEGLLGLAGREEVADRLEFASALYSTIAESAPETRLQERARAQLDAIVGRGAIGNRAEFLLRRFAREATHPSMLVGMAGAQAVFGLTRMAILSRLAASPTTSFFTRGFGARALASTGAFMLEAPSFVAFTRASNAALGQTQDWRLATLGREVAGSFITLGALKTAGALSTTAFNRLHGINPLTGQATRLTGFSAFSQRVLPQVAMFGGIVAGHNLETRLGIREHVDGATTMLDSLAMLMQFHVGGRLMSHALPQVEAFNRQLNIHSERIGRIPNPSRLPPRGFGELAPALAGSGHNVRGETASRPEQLIPDRFFMSSLENDSLSRPLNTSSLGEGAGRSESLPPSGSGSSLPPSSGGSRSRRPPSIGQRILRSVLRKIPNALRALSFVDSNRFLDPYAVPARPNTRPFPRSVESVEHGTRIAIAKGQGPDFAARVRRDLTELRNFSEVSEMYLQFRSRQLEIRRGERERLDPIHPLYKEMVEGLEADYRRTDSLLKEYERRSDEILGANTPLEIADLMVDVMVARSGADSAALQAYRGEATSRAGDNFDVFVPGAIETLFRANSRLAGEPGAQAIVDAARAYDEVAGPRQRRAQELAEKITEQSLELERLREEEAEPSSGRITELETNNDTLRREIKQIERDLIRASRGLKDNLQSFLGDSSRAQQWLIENAMHASLRRALRDPQSGLLADLLPSLQRPEGLNNAEWENFSQGRQLVLEATEALRAERGRRGIRSFIDLIARPFGARDYQQLWQARGNLQRATQDFLIKHENLVLRTSIPVLHSRTEAMDPAALGRLAEARLQVRTSFQSAGENASQRLEAMIPHVESYYRFHDSEYLGSREAGMRIGFAHAKALLAGLRTRLGDTAFAQQIEAVLTPLEGQFEANIVKYRESARNIMDGGSNPRDFNRAVEEPLKNITEAYDLYDKLASRDTEGVHATRIIPGFEHYTASWDYRDAQSTGRRILNIARYGAPAIRRILQIFSSERNGYPYEIVTHRFQDFGVQVGRNANPQTFYVQSHLGRIARYFRGSRSDFHATHLDFIGHSANAQAANEGPLGDNHTSPDIIAKIDLAIPVIDSVFPMLVNRIANNRAGVRLSEVRAAQMQNFGFLEAGRLVPRDSQNYDPLTMPTSDGMNPYAPNALEPVSETWPSFGRVFNIHDGATVVSSRLKGISLGTNQGAVRNYPNQRGPVYLENDATSYSNLFLPGNAFPEASRRMGKVSARNQLERMLWMMQGYHPETNPNSRAAMRVFGDFNRPVDLQIENLVSRLFAGVEEVYPTAEGIRSLERERSTLLDRLRANDGVPERALDSTADLNTLELLDRVLNAQTRTLLRNRLTELNLRTGQELESGSVPSAETAGLRRLQRVVQSRIRLLERIETKLAAGKPLDRTETLFVERTGAAIAGRDNTAGIDRLVEQIDYYFQVRAQGKGLRENLLEVQKTYYDFVHGWNERRRTPESIEYSQLHVSEAEGYDAVWTNYRRALETTLNIYNVTPARWNGQIIPDIEFRREGNVMYLQPRGWEPGQNFSRLSLWRFIADDTTGIVSVAKRLREFDPTPDLYLTLHGRGWGWRMLDRTQTRIEIDHSENFRQLANGAVVLAPTHDSGAEFMTIPAVAHDYGIRAFFMADRKFFDPFPRPPAFGIIKALLGPMDQYGHLAIDRSDRRSAFAVMDQTADSIVNTGRSYIIFPGSTRNPVQYNQNGERYEGPIYGSKAGVAAVMERGRGSIPVQPLALINGGIIFPKQNGDAFLGRGAAIGRTYIFRPGTPLLYNQVVEGNPEPKGPSLRNAVTRELDRQFGELTGRPIAAPAQSKAKKGR